MNRQMAKICTSNRCTLDVSQSCYHSMKSFDEFVREIIEY